MDKSLKHDSTKTFRPIIYQFLVALEKCFEMQDAESVWIEKYGDVTSSNGEQIEVKDYEKKLTDLDHNIWKTLKNWLDDAFDISHYHSLILLTTQTISPTSKFIDWNKKDKNEKLEILKSIAKEYKAQKSKSDSTQKLLDTVLNPVKADKLLKILNKFIIISEKEDDKTLYKKLIETRTDGILDEKRKEYIDSLLGYIIKPDITAGGWKIKNRDFRKKTKSLIETYNSQTVVFPKIEVPSVTDDTINEHSSYLFIKKIEDIDYNEIKSEAIQDFLYTRLAISDELKNFEISKKEYDSYEQEVLQSFKTKYRKALRDANSSNFINKSKDLYDYATGETPQNFYKFNDTPKSYRNGILHEIANDEENPTKLIWKLEVKDE